MSACGIGTAKSEPEPTTLEIIDACHFFKPIRPLDAEDGLLDSINQSCDLTDTELQRRYNEVNKQIYEYLQAYDFICYQETE